MSNLKIITIKKIKISDHNPTVDKKTDQPGTKSSTKSFELSNYNYHNYLIISAI